MSHDPPMDEVGSRTVCELGACGPCADCRELVQFYFDAAVDATAEAIRLRLRLRYMLWLPWAITGLVHLLAHLVAP